jgi:hypothetical protein
MSNNWFETIKLLRDNNWINKPFRASIEVDGEAQPYWCVCDGKHINPIEDFEMVEELEAGYQQMMEDK